MTTFPPRDSSSYFQYQPRQPPSPNAPLQALTPLSPITIAGPSRPHNRRSRSYTSSKSAPTSPAGRLGVPGLTPLSTISHLDIGQPRAATYGHSESRNRHEKQVTSSENGVYREQNGGVAYEQDGVNQQTKGFHPLPPVPPQPYQGQPATSHLQQPANFTQPRTGIPPLLNPAARIKTFPRAFLPRTHGSASDTETEASGNDSDATYRPRYVSNISSGSTSTTGSGSIDSNGIRHKNSHSQPDLTALRHRLEGWVGGVAKETSTVNDPKRSNLNRRKTPPTRQIPLNSTPHHPPTSAKSRSTLALTTLRKSPSGGTPPALISPMTPLLSSSSDGSSPRAFRHTGALGIDLANRAMGDITGSEGADADDDDSFGDLTDSPSSGSISFSSKRRSLRRRISTDKNKGGLGLTFGPDTSPVLPKKDEPIPVIIERRLQQSSLLSLRLLAIVPSVWGIAVLVQGFISGEIDIDVWPWGVDLSREALERLVAGGVWNEGKRRIISRGDMLLSIAWAICTAHFCFCLTTGLTYRWRSYYSLPSTLTRLLSLQCLCWPATYLTLWFLGAQRPLLAWVVIGVTTGWSRTVQMWVTSNVIQPTGGEVTPKVRAKGIVPEHLGFWASFTWERTWDWDAIARKVGWKIGILLLITTAWMFWGIETGRLVERV